MADYQISRLNPRDFEHLTQALAKLHISKGVVPFGDGPDGGREATFEGKMSYREWDGYLVIQCKFQLRPKGTSDDIDSLINSIKTDLDKFLDTKRNLKKPEYYLVVTNLVLTPGSEKGGRDRIDKLLQEYKKVLNLKSVDIWGYDDLCRFIDISESVRHAYYGFIAPGDVLYSLQQKLKDKVQPTFFEMMKIYLQKELLSDQSSKLENAGQLADNQISLAKVFTDLPISRRVPSGMFREEETFANCLSHLTLSGSQILRQTHLLQSNPDLKDTPARSAIVGGPGQGKSTVGQFLCQIHRVAILQGVTNGISHEAQKVIKQYTEQGDLDLFVNTGVRRFPIKIVLNKYATDLAMDKDLTVLTYIKKQIDRRTHGDCSMSDLKQWLSEYPWLIVFDGLDEVPSSSNRKQLLQEIDSFMIDVGSLDADIQIVATTRPQSYSNEFQNFKFEHFYLCPLSKEIALAYGKKLATVRAGDDESRRDQTVRRLDLASRTQATAKLMQSPLQVTIMTTLVERVGEPPKQRYRLFEQYYRTIYEREVGREGKLSMLLSDRKTDIDLIHYRAGLLLQMRSETPGKTSSILTASEFTKLVDMRLKEVEVQDPYKTELLEKISDTSLDRLVFLVRPEETKVSFELRSLQEFMAAEAILKDKEEIVVERLKMIAPISHWRNVFLFAVGKCFAEKEDLLEKIDLICRNLNINSAIEAEKSALWGSRLALDILNEDVSNHNPKYERLFAETALILLTIPDYDAARVLGSLYSPQLDDIYKKAIDNNLSNSFNKTTTLIMIASIADRGFEWAFKYLDESWPTDHNEQKNILSSFNSKKSYVWFRQKLEIQLQDTCADELKYSMHPTILNNMEKSDWLHPIVNSTLRKRISFEINGIQDMSLFFHGNDLEEAHHFEPLISTPENAHKGTLFLASGHFSKNPTHLQLAEDIHKLTSEDMREFKDNFFTFPGAWPVASALHWLSRNFDRKEELVTLLKNEELGTYEDWISAEKRWREKGITSTDFVTSSQSMLPWPKKIERAGVPINLVQCFPETSDDENETSAWQVIYQSMENSEAKSLIATRVIGNNFWWDEPQKKKDLPFTADEFQKLAESSLRYMEHKTFYWPVRFKLPLLNEQWISFFNWLGENAEIMTFPSGEFCREFAEELAAWFKFKGNDYPYLARVLNAVITSGNQIKVPRSYLQTDSILKKEALILTLTNDDISDKDLLAIVDVCAQDNLSAGYTFSRACDVLEYTKNAQAYLDSLVKLDALLKSKLDNKDAHPLRLGIITRIINKLSERRSGLEDSESIAKLKMDYLNIGEET